MARVYAFRPMSAADLPLVGCWLARPHVVQWWCDPHEQFDLVRGDLDHPSMDQFIVATAGQPFAYLQCACLSMVCWRRARRASSPIRIRATPVRSALMTRPDFAPSV